MVLIVLVSQQVLRFSQFLLNRGLITLIVTPRKEEIFTTDLDLREIVIPDNGQIKFAVLV